MGRLALGALLLMWLAILGAEPTGAEPGGAEPGGAEPGGAEPRYWFLNHLSAQDLVPADWRLLRQNIQLALYELEDGESVGWTEPVSEHSGSVRVMSTRAENNSLCRQLRVSVDVDAGSDDGIFQLCRASPAGFWQLTMNSLPNPN